MPTPTLPKHLRLAYILIHTVLFLPVLLWPLPTLIYNNPMLHDIFIPTWLICIVIQLLIAVGMDSMLYQVSSFKQALDTTLWVALMAMLSVSTLQKDESAWVFGILFLIHSLRAAFKLIQTENPQTSWWLWLAWGRDITSAIVILFWSALLATA
ncbi:MAG: hypothetical protein Q9M75_06815 [Ghiorsea sp.]|nr:hypothetical protein [Ghiorsea sp.]MDQ7057736.1 hypothetical protein [Ghiorsea sp.]